MAKNASTGEKIEHLVIPAYDQKEAQDIANSTLKSEKETYRLVEYQNKKIRLFPYDDQKPMILIKFGKVQKQTLRLPWITAQGRHQ